MGREKAVGRPQSQLPPGFTGDLLPTQSNKCMQSEPHNPFASHILHSIPFITLAGFTADQQVLQHPHDEKSCILIV